MLLELLKTKKRLLNESHPNPFLFPMYSEVLLDGIEFIGQYHDMEYVIAPRSS
jgi:hypothetical protein